MIIFECPHLNLQLVTKDTLRSLSSQEAKYDRLEQVKHGYSILTFKNFTNDNNEKWKVLVAKSIIMVSKFYEKHVPCKPSISSI